MNDETLQPPSEAVVTAPPAVSEAPPTVVDGPPPAAPDAFFPQLDGYRITGRLGEGGMGVVWRAEQLSTHRQVALKLMSAASFGSERGKARFNREVELTARLEHPNIARVYDGGLNRGVYFYAMELLEGPPLDRHVQQHRLDRRQILQLVQTVCQAVQHAHQRGIIHRDLKPSNVVVTADGQPHVLDFGLAKTLLHGDAGDTLSLDGEIAGTPAFMSPEQAAGRLDQIDTRTDVYSLGVILYTLLAGQNPHDLSGTYLDVMKRIVDVDVPSPRLIKPALDRELESLLLKPLAKDPARRYGSAGEFAEDIGRYLAGEPLRAKPATLRYVLGKRLRKHRLPLTIAAVVLAMLAGVAVYAWVKIAHEQQQRQADRRRSAPAVLMAARTLINQRQREAARVSVEQALEYDPGSPEGLLLRAALQIQRREYKAAAQTVARLRRSNPDDAELAHLGAAIDHAIRYGPQMSAGRLGDIFTRLKLFAIADDHYAAAGRMIDAYRARINAVWPGAGKELTLDEQGRLTLELARRRDVSDLSALAGIPLTRLNLYGTNVSDLSPLAGMPLIDLECQRTAVSDLSPLRGMRLERLVLNHSRNVSDLSPLAGMPLHAIHLNGTRVTDLSPLRGLPIVEATLTEMPHLTDLSPLDGAPIERLNLFRSAVRDLRPLAKSPVRVLIFSFCPVTDLVALKDMPLEKVQLDSCWVYDLAPLAGKQIRELQLQNTPVADVTLLRDMPLEKLVLTPHSITRGLELLRNKPGLHYIAVGGALSDQPADEFWRRYDAGEYNRGNAEELLRGLYRNFKRPTVSATQPAR